MKIELTSIRTQLTTLDNASRTCELTEPVSSRKPVLGLLMRLFCAAALALPAFGPQAAVVFTNLYSFTGGNDGANPVAGVVQGTDGAFYGTTEYGGDTNTFITGGGTVFKINTNGLLTTLYAFTGGNDGEWPVSGLAQGTDGAFYGTTLYSMFKISINGVLTVLSPTGSPNALVQGHDGNFYGTTYYSGTNNFGAVFQITSNGVLTALYSFFNGGGILPNGLVQGRDGNFYSTTAVDGVVTLFGLTVFLGPGTVFQIRTDGAYSVLYGFDNTNGASPFGALVQGSDGYLYGTTEFNSLVGGYGSGAGSVFKISTNGVYARLYSFGSVQDTNGFALEGANPSAALVQGSDGNFYGTTGGGGTNDLGTMFKISTTGVLTTLYSFTGGDGGYSPNGVVQGSDGSFYGTTARGGTSNWGTVFRLSVVPGPPQLTITPSGANVILTWPTNAAGFALQSTTNLASSVWITNFPAPVVVNGQYTVTNPISGSRKFYRLSSP